jgi:hypothetical protein
MHGLTVQSLCIGYEAWGSTDSFVANRVIKIQADSNIEWHHVPTSDNPADLGSRGGQPTEQWLNGPTWLGNEMKWPESPHLHASSESQSEAKISREVLAAAGAEPERDDHVNILAKHTLTKTLRIGAWVKGFIYNCKNEGPDTPDEIRQRDAIF